MPLHQRLFYLLVILLPTQLGYHFWPDWSFVLGRRLDFLAPTVYLTDVLVALTLISWLASERHKFTRHVIPVILLTVFAGINIWFAISWPVALSKWIKVGEFILLGYYIVKTRPRAALVNRQLALGVIFTSLLALVQFFLQGSLGGLAWFLGERSFRVDTPGIARYALCGFWANGCREVLRAYATFPHPNVLGGFLATSLPLFVIELSRPKNTASSKKAKLLKVLYVAAIILGLGALIVSFSRSAWLVLLLGLGFLLSLKKGLVSKVPRNIKWLGWGILSILILAVGFRLLSDFNSDSESVRVRQALVASATSMWQRSPIVGVGLNNFLIGLPQFLPSRTIYFLQPVHNIYLLLLAETGLVGLGFSLWWLWQALVSRHSKIFTDTYRLSLLSLLVLGLVDHYPVSLQQGALLLTLFLALSF